MWEGWQVCYPEGLGFLMSFLSNNHLFLHVLYCRLDIIETSLAALELSDDQKENMTSFLKEKRVIIRSGDLKEQDFERITELGSGNGGVVLKVKHIPSGIAMARKVSSESSGLTM